LTRDNRNKQRFWDCITAVPRRILLFLGYTVDFKVVHTVRTQRYIVIMCILYVIRFIITLCGMVSKNSNEIVLTFALNLMIAGQSWLNLGLKQSAYIEQTRTQMKALNPEQDNAYAILLQGDKEETITPFKTRQMLILGIFALSFLMIVIAFVEPGNEQGNEIVINFAFKVAALFYAVIPFADGLIEQVIIWYHAQVD